MSDRTFFICTLAFTFLMAALAYCAIVDEGPVRDGIAIREGIHMLDIPAR